MNHQTRFALLLLVAVSASVLAEPGGSYFARKDWEVACDNTLTCRMAGYSTEEDATGSVMFTRQPGPNTAVSGEITLADTHSDSTSESATPVWPAELILWIDNKRVATLSSLKQEGYWGLSGSQSLAIINAIKAAEQVAFTADSQRFVLSGEGAYPVMLKADDIQGRIGTPGALAKKGDSAERGVRAPIPAPVIQAVKVAKAQPRVLTPSEVNALLPKLSATLGNDTECDSIEPEQDSEVKNETNITVTPLSNHHALISTLCWRGAYNQGYGYWVMDSGLNDKPVLVTNSATAANDDKSVIFMSIKGTGSGDCWETASWVWNGQRFLKSADMTTGMCRGIRMGGPWNLPTVVAKVRPAKG